MKFFKVTVLLLLLMVTTKTLQAQSILGIGVGASYEIRDEEPRTGFGLRLEKDIISLVVVNIRSRINYSMFSEEYGVSIAGVSISQKSEGFDLSGAVTVGASLGLFGPYAGIGAGIERVTTESPLLAGDVKDASTFTYGLLGVAITPVPFVKPFVEYRYNAFLGDESDYSRQSANRFVIGVTVRF